jgi:hypothetical protein
MLLGIVKPIPSKPPDCAAIAALTPTTSLVKESEIRITKYSYEECVVQLLLCRSSQVGLGEAGARHKSKGLYF